MRKGLLFFSLLVFMGGIVALNLPLEAQETAASSAQGLGNIEEAVIRVADITGKAVVSISTEYTTKLKGGRRYSFSYPFGESPSGEDEFLRRFFDDFFGEIPDREYKQMGLGSGVIIDADGYILTNEHVVGDADKITVVLPDGREFKAELKGKDSRSDLAIIKIDAHNLPVASLGESDDLKIGQWVVAIGNPFGYVMQNPEPTVTIGVISALHRSLGRSISRDRDYNDLIQTDAAINPGNSGGPLVNLKGEVAGINVAIFSTSGGYQGIGFAIPVDNAKRIISRLIAGKKILYGWLGVTVQDLSEELTKYFGLPDKNGVLVVKVLEDSPAQESGIKDGDIIKRFDNKEINNVRDLLNIVGKTEVGRKVKAMLLREKKEITLEVAVGQRPQDIEAVAGEPAEAEATDSWRGLKVEDLTPENIKRFRLEEETGVVVVEIQPNSPAEESGIMQGEVILEINRRPVKNTADYQKLTKAVKGNALLKTSRGYFVIKESD